MNTKEKGPEPMGPFNKVLQLAAIQRIYASEGHGGGWGPAHNLPATTAPNGPKGEHCIEYGLHANECLCLAFPVDPSIKLPNDFFFPKDRNGTTKQAMVAAITSDSAGRNVLARYGEPPNERQTDTGNPWGGYVESSHSHNSATLALNPGVAFLWITTPDGKAANIPLAQRRSQ